MFEFCLVLKNVIEIKNFILHNIELQTSVMIPMNFHIAMKAIFYSITITNKYAPLLITGFWLVDGGSRAKR